MKLDHLLYCKYFTSFPLIIHEFKTLLSCRRMPKVGSTLLLNFFFSLHSTTTNDTDRLNATIDRRIDGNWVHYRPKELEDASIQQIQWKNQKLLRNVTKIVFVRDPLDRIISAWRDKFGPIGVVASEEVKSEFYVSLQRRKNEGHTNRSDFKVKGGGSKDI